MSWRAVNDDPAFAMLATQKGVMQNISGAVRAAPNKRVVFAEDRAAIQLRWQQVAQALTVQRWKRVLHLSAAAWAVGVALSLLMRGLVVEYRVGWESTFLDAGQVHSILSLLRWPTLLLFPFEPFTVQDVAALHHDGRIQPLIAARFPFARHAEAFALAQARDTVGRVLLLPG